MKVHYVGRLLSTNKIFASSFHTGSQPFRFVLGSDDVIAGWNQGLGDMCEGERRRLLIPWDLAYGEKGTKGSVSFGNNCAPAPRTVLLEQKNPTVPPSFSVSCSANPAEKSARACLLLPEFAREFTLRWFCCSVTSART